MTISELAYRLGILVPELDDFYKGIGEVIGQNFELTEEQIKKGILKFNPKDKDIISPNKVRLKGLDVIDKKTFNSDFTVNQSTQYSTAKSDLLNPYFKKSENTLLNAFQKHNSIPHLILEGDFRKVAGNDFGFFKNISHQNGTVLTYPVSNDSVDEIFIASGELINGNRYSFEATIARRHERTKKANPFLLQAKNENIEEIKELSAISQELKTKQEKLEEINTYLEKAEEHFEVKKVEIEEKVSKVFQEKQSEANEIIETYQEAINQKFNEIQKKEKELSSLYETVEATNNHLQKMENLLSTLKERVSLCRNLQFISEDDENKYLNLLSAKEFQPINHHDFEKDFERDFSKLSEHIHAYLYHKKNLIYTKHQIKNFLTLLKTHDIIVLSGLSGSGKTQIVKAFAEALGGVAKIIPVKPNWTSSDDLIGYYNPLQMSFLPTPFTEAIVEAINNPNQLYFICLDEMNLARAEYYFADFLSKLEERSMQPEIELYANHEEELFVSEFSTLLNLIESSIKGKIIKSWQEFLDNEEARKKFFEMLGNTDKESMLQLHAKMKRRLIDILKFPSTIRIPDNVRFIGAINVDETTHYFSPKILDRIHVVKFENPLLYEEDVNNYFLNRFDESFYNDPSMEFRNYDDWELKNNYEFSFFAMIESLKPIYVKPNLFSNRKEYPKVNDSELSIVTNKLKEINKDFLLNLNIDFGIRSIRQSINYHKEAKGIFYKVKKIIYNEGEEYSEEPTLSHAEFIQITNSIIVQKILPRFVFDGNDISINGKSKKEIVIDFSNYLKDNLTYYMTYDSDGAPMDDIGIESENNAYGKLKAMLQMSEHNGNQFNFFA